MSSVANTPAQRAVNPSEKNGARKFKLFALIAICLSPVVASYLLYFFWTPTKLNNYGDLIQPQRSAKNIGLTDLQGKPVSIDVFRKRFVMVTIASADCAAACKEQLFMTRQLRTMQGKERERVDRLWIIPATTNAVAPAVAAGENQEELTVVYAKAQEVEQLFPVQTGGQREDHIYLIDYQGNLMMRFPKGADPYKVKKDLSTLLKAASIR
jgi:cytochrome oxidase Cu insertion factor (SCO1/SenC/PrrC family)